jgi:tetratricopeptide (TPR) repeat protein
MAAEEKARVIFLQALEHPAAQWPDFVAAACAGQADLQARVDQLLGAHQAMGSIHRADGPAVTTDEPRVESAGAMVGPYKLLETIGEGGFGVVYLAEQQEPIRRKVALKVLKPGMDTKQVVARFEAERQALALMDHPNIAKVHDGGQTPLGRPYFVMELVRGIPITEFCDQHHLDIRQRLDLFVSVCQAVQHAHQKGIIHRDLKPSNILIASNDGTPVVKVIDFGIAKAMSGHLTDKTFFTGFAQMIGTPLYMSPEQAGQSNIDVDTRSDIYSLGVLLYELLTGTTPFDKEQLSKLGYDELRRIIREEEPPRPSTRISTLGDAASTASANRQCDPRALSRQVRGELDWIVMKALEKDRNRRYETASAFAADLQRYLSDEPVLACPPSAVYRLRKFARRNKATLLMTSVVAAALLIVVGTIGWMEGDHTARRREAERLAAQYCDDAEEAADKGQTQLARVAAARADGVLANAPVSDALRHRIQQLLQDLRIAEQVDEIRIQMADTSIAGEGHFAVAEQLAEYEKALRSLGVAPFETPAATVKERLHGRSVAVRQALIGALDEWSLVTRRAAVDPKAMPNLDWLHEVVSALDDDAWRRRVREATRDKDTAGLLALAKDPQAPRQAVAGAIRLADALALAKEHEAALRLLTQAQVHHPDDFWVNEHLYFLCRDMSRAGTPRWDEAAHNASIAVALRPKSAGAHLNLGNAYHHGGKHQEAAAQYARAVELEPKYAAAHNNLGNALLKLERRDEAIKAYQKAVEFNPRFSMAFANLGFALCETKRFEEGVIAFQRATAIDPNDVRAYHNLANAYSSLKMFDKALEASNQAVKLKPAYALAYYNKGNALNALKKYGDAVEAYRTAIKHDPKDADYHYNLANVLTGLNRPDEAIKAYLGALSLNDKNANAWMGLGIAYEQKNWPDQALAAYEKAIAIDAKQVMAHNNLGAILKDKGQLDEACKYFHKTIKLDPKEPRPHVNLASVYLTRREFAKAAEACRTAIALQDDAPLAWLNLGAALNGLRQRDEAIKAYQKAIQLDPKDPRPHHNIGNALSAQNRPGEAIEAYRRAIKVDDKYAPAHAALGGMLFGNGQFAPSIDAFRSAVAIDPTDFESFINLGTVFNVTKQFKEANQAWRTAIALWRKGAKINPEAISVYSNIGVTLLQRGEVEAAVDCFRKVVEVAPDGSNFNRLAVACTQAKHYDEASRAFRKAIELRPEHPQAFNNFAWFLATAEDFKVRDPKQAVELARKATQLDAKPWLHWNTLSVACYRAGDWQGAFDARKEAIKRNNGGNPADCFWQAMIHWQLKQKTEARNWYDRALDRLGTMTAPPDLMRLRAEAEALLQIERSKK